MGVILKTLSVCVPIYNEIENLEDLFVEFNEMNKSLNNTKIEIILIDNHSNDGTFDLFSKIVKSYNFKTIYVRHSQNYGYQVSLQTGLEYSTGDFVAVVDGDLQDPINLIPTMLDELIFKKLNIIYGVRIKRNDSLMNKVFYKLFYKIWAKVSDIDIQKDAGEFAIYDRTAVDSILKFKEKNRFQRGIRAYIGLNQAPFEYERSKRSKGQSKFNFLRQLKLAVDGFYSFSFFPIRAIMVIGLTILIISMILMVTSLVFRVINLLNPDFQVGQMGRGLVQVFILMTSLFGVVIVLLGVIGEYLGRIYEELRNRPKIIEDVIVEDPK